MVMSVQPNFEVDILMIKELRAFDTATEVLTRVPLTDMPPAGRCVN